ncbi:MAG: CHASE2 domain-containing protein, partial [Cyanobacteria bacterium P01_G01_bin.38]
MRWIAALITTPIVASVVIAVRFTGALQLLEWAAYDQSFHLRSREAIDKRIVLVTIEEADIGELGQWPLSDATLAQLIRNLNQYQPTVIGLDLYRDLPVEPGHQDWVEVMASTPNLIGVEKAIGRTVTPPTELNQRGQVALTDLLVDADGKVRRGLLSHDNPADQLRLG